MGTKMQVKVSLLFHWGKDQAVSEPLLPKIMPETLEWLMKV